MANEIQHRHNATGSTLYATIRDTSGQYFDVVVASAFETLVPASWNDYAISLSESAIAAGGYCYAGDVPAGLADGRYSIDVFEQSGSEPALADSLLNSFTLDWENSTEASLTSILNQVQIIDALIDAIKTKTDNLPADTSSELTDIDDDLAIITNDTDELQQLFDNIDSTGTETVDARKALEIAFAVLIGNTSFNTTTRALTVYGRDGTTVLATITVSNTINGTRTGSTVN